MFAYLCLACKAYMKNWVCDVRLSPHGFTVILGDTLHPVYYPSSVWKAFPQALRLPFAQFIAFMTTVHWVFGKGNKITYKFPAPLGEPLFYYGLFLSMPENLNDFQNSLKTSDYLKFVFNSFFKTSFTGHASVITQTPYKSHKKALVPFTFGKDSLLTFALCKELGIIPIPFFFIEKHKTYENDHRYRLIKKFKKEYKTDVVLFEVPLQELKQRSGLWWGWDIFLSQYTFFLVPFLHYFQASFLFWSNEYDRSITQPDKEGFMVAPTFDQTSRWLQVLDRGIKLFGCNAHVGSLLEPLTELSVHFVLHHRYSKLGNYQTSCNHEEVQAKTNRWCGHCYTCAEDYIFLKALGIDPSRVDYSDDMLKNSKRRWHYLFNKDKRASGQGNIDFFRNEHIFGLYLSYQRGIRGGLMDDFQKSYLAFARKNITLLEKTYLTRYPFLTAPSAFHKRLENIFDKELSELRRTVKKISSTHL